MSDFYDVAKRLDCRPDHRLVACMEVGLPVFSMYPLLTLRERSPIGVIEEFVLKCVDSGINTVERLTAFLGLPDDIVGTQVGASIYESLLREESPGQLGLTARGRERLSELAATRISKVEVNLFFDGFTRELVAVPRNDLYTERQLAGLGVPAIAPIPRRPPKQPDIPLSQVGKILALDSSLSRAARQPVKVESLVRSTKLLFRRAIALCFKPANGRGISISFAIDERIAPQHEVSYSQALPSQQSPLFRDLADSNRRRSDLTAARRFLSRYVDLAGDRSTDGPRRKTLALRGAREFLIKPANSKSLGPYEHVQFLDQALLDCTQRLVVVSRDLSGFVVSASFIESLEKLLRADVQVTLAFRAGKGRRYEPRDGFDPLIALAQLAQRYPKLIIFDRTAIPARVLVVDDRQVVVSNFDWLGHVSEQDRPIQECEGTYFDGKDAVDTFTAELLTQLAAEVAAATPDGSAGRGNSSSHARERPV